MRKQDKIIVYDPRDTSIVCALSHFWSQGYELHAEPFIGKNLCEILNNSNFWLLNTSQNIELKTDFDVFMWYSTSRKISLQDLSNINPGKHESPEITEFLKSWRQNRSLMALAREMRDSKTWNYAHKAARLSKALTVSRIINTPQDHIRMMMMVIAELNSEDSSLALDRLSAEYNEITRITTKILEKIKVQDSPFSLPGQAVAYAYLDNLSGYADIENIRKEALKKFPFLVILQFKKNGRGYTWIGSSKVNVRKIFDIQEPGSSNEILYAGDIKLTTKLLRQKIAELVY